MKFSLLIGALLVYTFSIAQTYKIAFGSCANQSQAIPILKTVASAKPDIFIFLGDNIYADTDNITELREEYSKLAAKPEFKELTNACKVIATWDDHDYGRNDAGAEFKFKSDSKKAFLEFWKEPKGSPRWKRQGIYTSYVFGTEKKVQVILLDTRTFRGSLKRGDNGYIPNNDKEKTMLGKEQWSWLKNQLKIPADIRIIASSTQFAAEFNGFEAWANLPYEKQKMLDLIEQTGTSGVIFISGDTHYAELSEMKGKTYPVYDLTSSGLTETWPVLGENKYRKGSAYRENNFGMIEIDWNAEKPLVTLSIRDKRGETRIEKTICLTDLKHGTK